MFLLASAANFGASLASGEGVLNGHSIRLDSSGRLMSWVVPQDQAYSAVSRLAWEFLLTTVPLESNGLKSCYSYCCLNLQTMRGTGWLHNLACANAGLVDGAAAWYAFSGDRRVVGLARDLVSEQIIDMNKMGSHTSRYTRR